MSLSRLAAWAAVRGKPSRMNDAEGDNLRVRAGFPVNDEGTSQPFDVSSEEMRSMIIESGTRLPACIADSALRPGGSES